MKRTEEILYHLVNKYYEEYPNGSIGETKLLKLLYLSDRKSMEDNNRRLTGINYVNYMYGPYSEDVKEAIEKADESHLFHRVEDRRSSKSGNRYEFCNCPQHKTEVRFEDSDGIINSVVKEYGSMSDKELIEFVKSLPEIRDKDKYVPIKIDDIADKNS
jgi:uncharacterized phage-associated protein